MRGICFFQVEAVPSSEELPESVDVDVVGHDTMEAVAPPPSSEMLVSSGKFFVWRFKKLKNFWMCSFIETWLFWLIHFFLGSAGNLGIIGLILSCWLFRVGRLHTLPSCSVGHWDTRLVVFVGLFNDFCICLCLCRCWENPQDDIYSPYKLSLWLSSYSNKHWTNTLDQASLPFSVFCCGRFGKVARGASTQVIFVICALAGWKTRVGSEAAWEPLRWLRCWGGLISSSRKKSSFGLRST